MTIKLITMGIILVVCTTLGSVSALAINTSTTSPTPREAVREKTASATDELNNRPVLIKEKLAKVPTLARVNGVITAISGNKLTVNGMTVNVNANTILLRRFGAKATLAEFSVKDEVQVIGKWADANKTTVDARLIRNLSIQKRHGTFVGTVQTILANGFTLQPIGRPLQTVTVNSGTKYVERANKPIAFSALAVGHKVQIKGMWDNKLNTVTEVTFVRDYSLPVRTDKVATKSGITTLPAQAK